MAKRLALEAKCSVPSIPLGPFELSCPICGVFGLSQFGEKSESVAACRGQFDGLRRRWLNQQVESGADDLCPSGITSACEVMRICDQVGSHRRMSSIASRSAAAHRAVRTITTTATYGSALKPAVGNKVGVHWRVESTFSPGIHSAGRLGPDIAIHHPPQRPSSANGRELV